MHLESKEFSQVWCRLSETGMNRSQQENGLKTKPMLALRVCDASPPDPAPPELRCQLKRYAQLALTLSAEYKEIAASDANPTADDECRYQYTPLWRYAVVVDVVTDIAVAVSPTANRLSVEAALDALAASIIHGLRLHALRSASVVL
eukprot:2735571-Pyramimonas_sp.AAC.1